MARRFKGGRRPTLSDADRDAIRERLARGELGKDLAVEYGVSQMTISKIRNAHRPETIPTQARIAFLTAKFWSRVSIRGENECWNFDKANMKKYGTLQSELCGSTLAHVISYSLTRPDEPLPDVVRHLCDNRACCNPSHLKGGTSEENHADRKHRRHLEASGHTGPTPVLKPVPPPPGGWPIHADLEEARLALDKEEFLTKVTITADGCWLWNGRATHAFGYGQIRGMNSHRYAYRLYNGPLPLRPLAVLHRCGHAACCNPDHLYAGTAKQNAADAKRHGTKKTGAAHPRAQLDDDQVQVMRERYWSGGQTLEGVAEQFGVANGTASRVLRGVGYPGAPGPVHPTLRGARARRLDAGLVAEVRRRAAAGETVPALSRDLGIHPETLRDVVAGRSWKSVVDDAPRA